MEQLSTKDLDKNLNRVDRFLLNAIRDKDPQPLTDDYTEDELLHSSIRHGVFPFLLKNFSNKNWQFSDGFQTGLRKRQSSLNNYISNLVAELDVILNIFEQENIALVVLKGAYLSKVIYPQPDLRIFSDIDLLVKEEDLPKAVKCLKAIGFKEVESNKELEKKEQRGQIHLAKERVMIDLHWEIINDGLYRTTIGYETKTIFDNCTNAYFNGHKILEPSPTELVIYLAMHLASQHAFARLMWFNDLNHALEKFAGEINWHELIQSAKKRLISAQVYYALLFTRELLNSKVPQEALDKLKPKNSLAKLFEILVRKQNIIDLSRKRRNLAYQVWLILRDNWRLSFKALVWRIFPSIEWFMNYYPLLPKISPYYYWPVYPLLIAMRFIIKPRKN